jgi:acetyltransferase
LAGYRDRPPADRETLAELLIKLGQIAADHVEITELDINPLLCDQTGVIAIDGRIRVRASSATAHSRMAIRPYPENLTTTITTPDGNSIFVRPIRPEDEPALRRLARTLDPTELWHEFFSPLRDGTRQSAARLSQIDYDREMTFVALRGDTLVGIARMTADPDFESADCAVLVQNSSLDVAQTLLQMLLEAAAAQGIRHIVALLPADRTAIVNIYRDIRFDLAADPMNAAYLTARRAV